MRKPPRPGFKAGGHGGGSGGPVRHRTPRAGFKGAGTSGGSGGGRGGPVPPQKPKKPKAKKPRKWSPGWDAECCTAEAVGRLLGLSDSQVLELDAASDRTIAGTLEVAGVRELPGIILGVALPQPHAIAVIDGVWWSWGEPFNPPEWPQLVIEEVWCPP